MLNMLSSTLRKTVMELSNGAGVFQPANASSTIGEAFGGARDFPAQEFGNRRRPEFGIF